MNINGGGGKIQADFCNDVWLSRLRVVDAAEPNGPSLVGNVRAKMRVGDEVEDWFEGVL